MREKRKIWEVFCRQYTVALWRRNANWREGEVGGRRESALLHGRLGTTKGQKQKEEDASVAPEKKQRKTTNDHVLERAANGGEEKCCQMASFDMKQVVVQVRQNTCNKR